MLDRPLRVLVGWLVVNPVSEFLTAPVVVDVDDDQGPVVDKGPSRVHYCGPVGRQGRNGSLVPLLVVGMGVFAGSVVHVTVRTLRRLVKDKECLAGELLEVKGTLKEREAQVTQLSEELFGKEKALNAKDGEMKCKEDELHRTVLELKAKTEELRRQERNLEQLKGELGVSRSTISMVERELKATKRLLASYQGQLDQAHVLRESKRMNMSHDLTSPGAMGIGSLWSNE